MRDINRIEPFMAEMVELWKKHPDQRFGQFMSNILGEVANSTRTDIFYLEDEQMMKAIKNIDWLK